MATSKKPVNQLAKAINKGTKLDKGLMSVIKSTKSYKDFLDLSPGQVSKLKVNELRSVVARLNRVEKKRLSNIEKMGGHGQALNALIDTGGVTRASIGMTRQQLLHEYKRAKAFLLSDTSTVAGVREYLTKIEQNLGANRTLTKDEIKRAYDLLHKYEESGAVAFYEKGSSKSVGFQQSLDVQKEIWDMINNKNMSDDQILAKLGVLSRTEAEARQDTSDDYNMFKHNP